MNPPGKKNTGSDNQIPLPGLLERRREPEQSSDREGRISHLAILEALQDSEPGSRGVVEIYKREVLPIKTRTLRLLGKKSLAVTNRTLLGFEVQASFKRIHCPDLVTARYLRLFTELGCSSIKLPYNPAVTERLIPELESAIHRLEEGVRERFPDDRKMRLYVTRKLYQHIRNRLRAT
jgi:hypothetical protein